MARENDYIRRRRTTVNVQSDWNATDGDAYIKNKPSIRNDNVLADNDSLYFGDGSDLSIYHDGTYNIIKTVNGAIRIMSGSECMIEAIPDGQVRLFYNNSQKLRTDNDGISVSGTKINLSTTKTPSSATDTGTTGDICWDSSYVYVCVATNTWKRSAISTW